MDKLNDYVKLALEVLTIIAIIFSGLAIHGLNIAHDLAGLKNNLSYIGLSTVIALGIAILVIFEGLPETWPTALMWGTGCFACGAVLGLIFGIPPYVEAKPMASNAQNAPLLKAQADLDSAKKADAIAQEALKSAAKAKLAGPLSGSTTTQAALDISATDAEHSAATTKANLAMAQANLDELQKGAGKQTEESDTQAKYGANTNLTDISDWLTKIIVGVGLVQLGKIRGQLKDAANFVAGGLVGIPQSCEHICSARARDHLVFFRPWLSFELPAYPRLAPTVAK